MNTNFTIMQVWTEVMLASIRPEAQNSASMPAHAYSASILRRFLSTPLADLAVLR